jgi:hypothetical protein
MESDTDVSVHVVSDLVGTDGGSTCGLLLYCLAAGEAEAGVCGRIKIMRGASGFCSTSFHICNRKILKKFSKSCLTFPIFSDFMGEKEKTFFSPGPDNQTTKGNQHESEYAS